MNYIEEENLNQEEKEEARDYRFFRFRFFFLLLLGMFDPSQKKGGCGLRLRWTTDVVDSYPEDSHKR